jgi:hypothetical protein
MSKFRKALVAKPQAETGRLQLYHVIAMVLTLVLPFTSGLKAQNAPGNKNPAPAPASKRVRKSEIVLIYYPSIFRAKSEDSEYVLVTVQADGDAEVVLHGPFYWSDSVRVYQGRLPKAYVGQLVKRTEQALLYSFRRHYEGGPQDEDVFYLSDLPLSQTFTERSFDYFGLLETPVSISALIYELRTVWKRLEKVRPAYAYIRVESVGSVSPQDVRREVRFISLQAFSPELRAIVVTAIKKPLSFHALSRPQSVKILSVTHPRSSINVVVNGLAYRFNLYLPRPEAPSTSKETPNSCSYNLLSHGNASRRLRFLQ